MNNRISTANIAQGSYAPVFKSREANGINLACSGGCGSLLIEDYYADSFVDIAIRCFVCGTTTTTEPLPDGEVLCRPALAMDMDGTALINGTVDYSPTVMMASKRAIDGVIAKTVPHDPPPMGHLVKGLLDDIEQKFIASTGADVGLQAHVLSRGGIGASFRFPVTWALSKLNAFVRNDIGYGKDFDDAISIISMFWNVYHCWKEHPRFYALAAHLGSPDMFFHAAFTMINAKYLYDHGNAIGLSLEDKHGQPNPDLYVRIKANVNHYIEVKAPPALQIRYEPRGPSKACKAIFASSVKNSSPQISRKRPGVLLIGISNPDPQLIPAIDASREGIVKSKGRDHRGMAALFTMRPMIGGGGFTFDGTLNPHFEGDNRVRIG